jgi:hypothetical protein
MCAINLAICGKGEVFRYFFLFEHFSIWELAKKEIFLTRLKTLEFCANRLQHWRAQNILNHRIKNSKFLVREIRKDVE